MIDRKKLEKRLNKGSKLKEYPLLNFYILVAVFFEIIGQAFRIFTFQMLKPLPLILMIFYIHKKNSPREHLMPSLVEAGLFLSLIGDVLLMFNDDSTFAVGTIFFGVSHIVYIIAFRMGYKVKQLPGEFKWMRMGGYLFIVVVLLLNIFFFWDKYPSRVLFISYSVILSVEAITALSRYEISNRSSFYFIMIGVGMFAVSDSLLAFLKFNAIKTDLGRFMIMLTYFGSQYFIMHGALHQSNLQYEIDNYDAKQKRIY